MKYTIIKIAVMAIMVSCSHHRDVRPGETTHKVYVSGDTKNEAARNAIHQAEYYCKKRKKHVAFTSEENKFISDLSEKEYKKIKSTAGAMETLGAGGAVFSDSPGIRTVGSLMSLAGNAVDKHVGHGYGVEMQFKCI